MIRVSSHITGFVMPCHASEVGGDVMRTQMLTEERAKLRTTRDELADKLSHMERMYNQNALKLQELKQAHEVCVPPQYARRGSAGKVDVLAIDSAADAAGQAGCTRRSWESGTRA
jgi:hypothetical protein